MLTRWGVILTHHARSVLVVGVLALVGAGIYGAGVFDHLSRGGFTDEASESARTTAMVDERFAHTGDDVIVIYSSDSMEVDDPAYAAAVDDVVRSLPADLVARTTTWYDTESPALVSADRHATMLTLTLAESGEDEQLDAYDELLPYLDADGLSEDVGGMLAVFNDVNHQTSEDIERAELFSLPLVLLLSLIIFGSVVAALMPVGIGVVSIVTSLAVVRLLSEVTDVSMFAINIITLLGLGLAIDYALFVISRFREELALRRPVDGPDDRQQVADALVATLATAGRTVLFSGLTVAAALSSMLVFPQAFLQSMAYGGVAAVLVAMIASLTLLPATLMLVGRRIDAGRMPWRRNRTATPGGSPAWGRFAAAVMRRPIASLVVTVGFLAVLSAPFLQATWGSVDERVLPSDAPSRVASDLAATEFDQPESQANIVVTGVDEQGANAYADQLASVDGVRDVQLVGHASGGSEPAALLLASWDADSQGAESKEIVENLRDVEAPAGAEALVGGTSAETVDLIDSIGDRFPLMVAIVIVVMLVLLFIGFGSVVLPIKAVAVNVLSIGAAFGVVTWIFQDGNLSGLLGFDSLGYLEVTQPILMFAILFGLSMDYEVFLLSRVREHWDATGHNELSVVRGVQSTGRIITSAAVLLAVVIGAFATSGVLFMKMIGIGMLVALLLDATVVRLVLVPATMKLLGGANWWAPAPMRRWWERYGLRESAAPVRDGNDSDRELVTTG